MSRLVSFVLAIVLSCNTSFAANNCIVEGYTLAFINGVNTKNTDAVKGLRMIKSLTGMTSYNGEKIKYELLYNYSGIENSAIDLLEDFVETFDQRTNQIGEMGVIKWVAFWDLMSGKTNTPVIERLILLFPEMFDLVNNWIAITVNNKVRVFLKELWNWFGVGKANTSEVRKKFSLQVDTWTWQGKKIVYIAHSQGNLWATEMDQYTTSKKGYGEGNTDIIHIAPATPLLKGDYILSDNDFVIKGLNLTGTSSEPDANFEIPFNSLDKLGHGLETTYLADSGSRQKIKNMIINSLSSVSKPLMNDYLFKLTYDLSSNYVRNVDRLEVGFVDANEDPDFDFCQYTYCTEYTVKESVAEVGRLRVVEKYESPGPITVTRGKASWEGKECSKTEYGSYVIGQLNSIRSANSTTIVDNVTFTMRLEDRHKNILINRTVDVSEGSTYGLRYAGEIDFTKLIISQQHYSSKDKSLLRQLNMSGTFSLDADLLYVEKIEH